MKYALKIERHSTPMYEHDGTLIDNVKIVTVRTKDGRQKSWRVGLKILDNEEMFEKFRKEQIEPWVNKGDKGQNGKGILKP